LLAFSVFIGNHLSRAEHSGRRRADVVVLAVAHLLA
jgi:hypothetical protein